MFFWSKRHRNDVVGFWERASLSLLWHLLTSVRQFAESQARKPPGGEKLAPTFSPHLLSLAAVSWGGNWAGPWVAGFMPEIAFAWCRECFTVQRDPCNDSWRPALRVVSGCIAIGKQQANPEDFIQSLARHSSARELSPVPSFFHIKAY